MIAFLCSSCGVYTLERYKKEPPACGSCGEPAIQSERAIVVLKYRKPKKTVDIGPFLPGLEPPKHGGMF